MPLWASWLKDFDILNIFYDELKIEKMAKFEILIATNGLSLLNQRQFTTERERNCGVVKSVVTTKPMDIGY